jgi:hypothetical protein
MPTMAANDHTLPLPPIVCFWSFLRVRRRASPGDDGSTGSIESWPEVRSLAILAWLFPLSLFARRRILDASIRFGVLR